MSPFQALYEYPPPLLQQLPVPIEQQQASALDQQEKESMVTILQQNLTKAQLRMKKYADANRIERQFDVGDLVYLKMKSYRETALGMHNPPKLSPRWYGPFKVLQKVGQVSYQLQLPTNCKLHDIFHVSHLKKHKGERAVPNPILPMVTDEGKVKIVPIAVLQRRTVPRSSGDYEVAVPQWLIHWDTMTSAEATWEDAEFIQKAYPGFQP
jgi:hypothetical protein